eukprot:356310-Chlamydomonas_euryale.AAC.6
MNPAERTCQANRLDAGGAAPPTSDRPAFCLEPSSTPLVPRPGALQVRASFSNIPLWHALMEDSKLAMGAMRGGIFKQPAHYAAGAAAVRLLNTGGGPPGAAQCAPSSGVMVAAGARARAAARASDVAGLVETAGSFRPRVVEYDVRLGHIGMLLCNDKANSFGAPDVLQVGRSSFKL